MAILISSQWTGRHSRMDRRVELGRIGERLAEAVLVGRGMTVLGRNVAVGRGEVDLVMRTGRQRVVVEVRTVVGSLRPEERFHVGKRRQVSSLAGRMGVGRVDLVGVGLDRTGVTVHWSRDVPSD
jgi:hypothetical protein